MARRENMSDAEKRAAVRAKKLWKERARKLGLTQEKLAEKYKDRGITQTLLSNWLNQWQGMPEKGVLILATELQSTPEYIFPEMFEGLTPKEVPLTPEDQEFAKLYQQCSPELRAFIKATMRVHLDAQKQAEPEKDD